MIALTVRASASKLAWTGRGAGAGRAVASGTGGAGVSAAGGLDTATPILGAGGSDARTSASIQATEKSIAAATKTARPAARTIKGQ